MIEALIQTDLASEYVFNLDQIDLLYSAYHLNTNNDLHEIDKLMISPYDITTEVQHSHSSYW